MALALGRPIIAGAGFNWNSSAIGSESGSGKEAAGGDGSAAPSSGSDFLRADPTLTRTPGGGESSGAGGSSERGLRSKETSRASKKNQSRLTGSSSTPATFPKASLAAAPSAGRIPAAGSSRQGRVST